MADLLDLGRADDGHLFKVRVLNTGEERIARYHHTAIGNVLLGSNPYTVCSPPQTAS